MIADQLIISLFFMLAIGLLAGFIGSILGIGGGLIVTPLLTMLVGIDIKHAIAASIIVVIATSSGSAIAYLKDKILNLKAAMYFEIFTSIGGLLGALAVGIIAPQILYFAFSAVLICSIINSFFKIKKEKLADYKKIKSDKICRFLKLESSYYNENLKKNISYNLTNVPFGSAFMLLAGFMSRLLGIGSGIFKVIAMEAIMKMPLKASSATSNLMMGVTAASSALVYFFSGFIIPQITVPVVIGVLCGAIFGSKIMPKLPKNLIRILFIFVALILCIQMLSKAIGAF